MCAPCSSHRFISSTLFLSTSQNIIILSKLKITQTDGKIDAWVSATGTGGTYAGVSYFLKEKDPNIRCVLADPMGSALYNYFNTGELKVEGSHSDLVSQAAKLNQHLQQTESWGAR